ncbi:MAG: redox-sensing transcriptional repressor Rex [Clostridiales bacterium]|nr:redox-sensing transcriptional repressor Rex [Clostridiales bacterium]
MAKSKGRVSDAVMRRMPKYYRYLKEMRDDGIERISSRELSDKMGLTASQIRQDFNSFGGFGQQGYGYNVNELYEEIQKILGLDKTYNCIVIGAGNLGQALTNYSGFEREGFHVMALFDINPRLIGMSIRDIPILDIEDIEGFLDQHRVDIAAICAPKDAAQSIADDLIKYGVRGIWNFAPTDVTSSSEVVIENVHLSDNLHTISFRMGGYSL